MLKLKKLAKPIRGKPIALSIFILTLIAMQFYGIFREPKTMSESYLSTYLLLAHNYEAGIALLGLTSIYLSIALQTPSKQKSFMIPQLLLSALVSFALHLTATYINMHVSQISSNMVPYIQYKIMGALLLYIAEVFSYMLMARTITLLLPQTLINNYIKQLITTVIDPVKKSIALSLIITGILPTCIIVIYIINQNPQLIPIFLSNLIFTIVKIILPHVPIMYAIILILISPATK